MSEPEENSLLLEENDREPELPEGREDLQAAEPAEPEAPAGEPEIPTAEWTAERQREFEQLTQQVHGLKIALGRQRSRRELLEGTIQERLDALNAKLNPPEPIPSVDDQPVQYLDRQIGEVRQSVAQMAEMQRQQQIMSGVEAFRQTVRSEEASFVQSHPDYYERVGAGRQVLVRALMAQGCPEEDLVREVFRFEAQLSKNALESGMSPAQAAYELASQFAPQNGSPAPQEAPGGANGAPAGQPATTPGIEAAKRAKSLSQTSGAPSKGTITLADLADDEIFERIYATRDLPGSANKWREVNDKGRTSMPS